MRLTTAEQLDFTDLVRPGDRVTWGQCAAEPEPLTRALMAQRHRVGGRFSVLVGASWSDVLQPEHADVVDFQSWTGAGANRRLAEAGVLDVLCCHYSTFESAFGRGGTNAVDVLLLQVAPPGTDGCYSLAVAHEYLAPLVDSARLVIAEVNEAAPWTGGGRLLRDSDIDLCVYTHRPLPERPVATASSADLAIAERIADLIDDGATLQLGVGAVPDALLQRLQGRRDLGIHSGALFDAMVDLIEQGVVTNARKTLDTGVTVGGVLMGGHRINTHAHRNPKLQLRPTSYTHSVKTLAALDRLVSVNSAIEVDLTGQVNAEVAGGRYVGAVGGALDFIRGAGLSQGGFSVIGLPARAGTRPRIVAQLQGPVSTPRSDVGLVVTEYGTADLRGASLAQRRRRLLDIAHPDDRTALEAQLAR